MIITSVSTPRLRLFRGFGEECSVWRKCRKISNSRIRLHMQICAALENRSIQAVLEGKVEQLVLVNCCDSMRRVYDIVESTGKCKFYICWICRMMIMNVKK